jgi:selenium metabolism protein YedF
MECPAPVIQTKNTIETEHPNVIQILVDNEAAKQNVTRFLKSQRFVVSAETEGAEFCVIGKKEGDDVPEKPVAEEPETARKKIMVMIGSDKMGRGDDGLGSKLMVNFIKTLKEMGDELWRLVFVNNGVKLTIEGAETLPDIKELEEGGIYILVCGTCLTHFDLLDKKQVGETTNMLDIVTAMQVAEKVINI